MEARATALYFLSMRGRASFQSVVRNKKISIFSRKKSVSFFLDVIDFRQRNKNLRTKMINNYKDYIFHFLLHIALSAETPLSLIFHFFFSLSFSFFDLGPAHSLAGRHDFPL